MSLTTIPNLGDYVDRIAATLEKDATLFPAETSSPKLVNKIHKQKPALDRSPDTTFMPYIFVTESRNPFRTTTKVGRSSINEDGPTLWELEFYCVIVVEAIDTVEAQEKIHPIDAAVRNALLKNKRLRTPPSGTDPIARNLTLIGVPYLLNLNTPNIQAWNIIVRPQVYVNLRS